MPERTAGFPERFTETIAGQLSEKLTKRRYPTKDFTALHAYPRKRWTSKQLPGGDAQYGMRLWIAST